MADVPSSVNQAAPAAEAVPAAQTQQSTNTTQTAKVEKAAAAVVSDPNASPGEKAQAKKMLKELKIKFNGKDYVEKLPFEIPDDEPSRDYMARQLQMSRLAQSKSAEHADLSTRVAAFIKELQTNPRKVLADKSIGVDVKKMAAELIEEEIANSKKSPDQLEREKLQQELKALKEEQDRERQGNQERERVRLQEHELQRYDVMLTQALEKSDLPKSAAIVKRISDYMYIGLKDLNTEFTPEEIIPLVREEMQQELKEMFAIMPEEVLEQFVGKENFDRVRKKRMASAKNAPPAPLRKSIPDTATQKKKVTSEPKKQNFKDFFKF